jgi:hypothetical protein
MPGSLWSVYAQLTDADQRLAEKIAADEAPSREVAEETAKLAVDYDEAGRRLARAHWEQFKTAEAGDLAQAFGGTETPAEEAAEEKERKRKEADKKKAGGASDEKKEKSDGEKLEEKKASIARRMVEDPGFRQEMIAQHHRG